MAGGAAILQAAAADDAAAPFVAAMLSRGEGTLRTVRSIERRTDGYATLFPTEVLRVTLDDGRTASVFLKYLGNEQADHPDKLVRGREVLVYERLLSAGRDADLPVARYYGSRANERTGRIELYLEHVDALNLKYHGWPGWDAAVARLGDLHAHFAARRNVLLEADYLLRLDETYHVSWAGRAMADVAAQSADLGRELEPIVAQYEPVAALLAGRPVTLLHNDLGPKNVVVDVTQSPPRVCLIDWEMAGVGCALLDLVHLTYNRMKPDDDRRLLEIYRGRVAGADLLPYDERELRRLRSACELHRTLYRLAHCRAWGRPLDYVADRVRYAGELCASLG